MSKRKSLAETANEIQIVTEIAVSAVLLYILLKQHFPDFNRTLTMKACRFTARTANRQAEFWTHVAGAANTRYFQCTNVTV